MERRFSIDELRSLEHALDHLEHNGILKGEPGSWYSGRKDQFMARHQKAITLISTLITNGERSRHP